MTTFWYAIPLIVAFSFVYAATRHESWQRILSGALRVGVMIVLFMLAVLAVLWLVTLGL